MDQKINIKHCYQKLIKPFMTQLKSILMMKSKTDQVDELSKQTNLPKFIGMLIFMEKYYQKQGQYFILAPHFREIKRVLLSTMVLSHSLMQQREEILALYEQQSVRNRSIGANSQFNIFLNNTPLFEISFFQLRFFFEELIGKRKLDYDNLTDEFKKISKIFTASNQPNSNKSLILQIRQLGDNFKGQLFELNRKEVLNSLNFLKENIGNYTSLFSQLSQFYEIVIFVFNMVENKESYYIEQVYLFFGTDVIYEITSTLDKIEIYFQDQDMEQGSIEQLHELKEVSSKLQRQIIQFLNTVFLYQIKQSKNAVKDFNKKTEYVKTQIARKTIPSIGLFIHYLQVKSGVQSYESRIRVKSTKFILKNLKNFFKNVKKLLVQLVSKQHIELQDEQSKNIRESLKNKKELPWDQLKWKAIYDIKTTIDQDIKRLKPYLKKEIQKEIEEEQQKREEQKQKEELEKKLQELKKQEEEAKKLQEQTVPIYSEVMVNIFQKAEKYRKEDSDEENFQIMQDQQDLMYDDEYDDTLEHLPNEKGAVQEDEVEIEIINDGYEEEYEETEEEFKNNIGYISKLTRWDEEQEEDTDEALNKFSQKFMVDNKNKKEEENPKSQNQPKKNFNKNRKPQEVDDQNREQKQDNQTRGNNNQRGRGSNGGRRGQHRGKGRGRGRGRQHDQHQKQYDRKRR